MTLFSQLRQWVDDDPTDLVSLAHGDESVCELCKKLSSAASRLTHMEDARATRYAAPVDPRFIEAWRDYQRRYADAVSDVDWEWLYQSLEDIGLPSEAPAPGEPEADRRWRIADELAYDGAKAFQGVLDFAADQTEDRELPDDFVEEIEAGLHEWHRLKNGVGFDVRGVLRRRRLVPFFLVPRHVAAAYGTTDKVSLLTNLQAANDAFVFGIPLAALAMMRSILEVTLRDHYGTSGQLDEQIEEVRHSLPFGVSADRLHLLRRRANVTLHLDREKVEKLPPLDPTQREQEVVSLLLALQTLIERAPVHRVVSAAPRGGRSSRSRPSRRPHRGGEDNPKGR